MIPNNLFFANIPVFIRTTKITTVMKSNIFNNNGVSLFNYVVIESFGEISF